MAAQTWTFGTDVSVGRMAALLMLLLAILLFLGIAANVAAA